MSASTAIATTATADREAAPVGRFAPSPTGPLHAGSLLAALASCLDARAPGGHWLVRIDDLDAQRCLPGMADEHLRVLEALGFEWHGAPLWQSRRLERYRAAIADLRAQGLAYDCSCSRRELAHGAEGGGYPGTCRDGPRGPAPWSVRYRYDRVPVGPFDDLWQGRCDPASGEQGDPVIGRRDGLPAYQLAVVLDDHDSGVNRVVRGADLLASTHWQRSLQRALGLAHPAYGHVPLLVEADGSKLAKSRHSLAVNPANAPALLHWGLGLLGQAPPGELAGAPVGQIWAWSLTHWKVESLPRAAQLALPPALY